MRPVRGQIRFAMALSSLAALLGVGFLLSLAWAIRRVGEAPRAWPLDAVLVACLCLAGAYFARLASFGQSHRAAFRLETILRRELVDHVARVSLGTVQQTGATALAKVVHDDVKALHVFVADSTPFYARAFVAPVAMLAALAWLDWRLALCVVAMIVAGGGVLSFAMRSSVEIGRAYHAARERVSAAVVEFVQAMPVVRTFDIGYATFGRYQQALDAYLEVLTGWYRRAGAAARLSSALLNPLPGLFVLAGFGAVLCLRGSLDFATWIGALLIGAGVAEAVLPMMALHHMVEKAKLSVAWIGQIMALPAMSQPADGRVPRDASVTFEHVRFGYGHGAPALRDVSFHAAPGTTTALVGSSGAGKTTVAQLIPRFRDVDAGRVLIGGVDVRDISTDTLMAQVAFVFQDSFLLADTIAANIRLGSPDATLDEVVAAARAAQAHDFIAGLPDGYDTPAGERGVFLSGGQQQRIAIARAILQRRPILVLDEATAFSDPETEAELIEALSRLMRGKTVIIVAHRLATIRHANQILVFDGGELVEHGRHGRLMALGGVYARLWRCHERAHRWRLRGETEPEESEETGEPADRSRQEAGDE
ncbi:ABC transporter ATP-binding protein [Burkholderia perseverans]|uniref:ABC transporter ATP-binding protein n=1 Tax=Burkholderia perseverans TaxID=2615214 RepID=UPI001FEE8F71|nr:ABC transporter ATP-binding protein [Burkholderia perseverans]